MFWIQFRQDVLRFLLTERRDHLDYFVDSLSEKVKNIIVLTGGMSSKQRNEKMDQLRQKKVV